MVILIQLIELISMKFFNVVIVSDIDWCFVKQRHQQFAEMFALAGYNVTWINRLGSRSLTCADILRLVIDFLWRKKSKHKCKPPPSSIKFKRIITLPFRGGIVDSVNTKLLKFQCQEQPDTLVVNYIPQLWIYDAFPHSEHIYECVNRFTKDPSINQENYKRYCEKMSLIVTDSTVISGDLKELGLNSKLIGPGLSPDFQCIEMSDAAEKCLFFGHLRQDNDLDVIRLVRNQIKVEGAGVNSTNYNVNSLFDKWHGRLEREDLPMLIKEFKYILLPYKTGEYQNGIIPAKFYESLATSRIVLVSGLEYSLSELEEKAIVRINSSTLFPIERDEAREQAAIDAVEGKLWEDRFSELLKALEDV